MKLYVSICCALVACATVEAKKPAPPAPPPVKRAAVVPPSKTLTLDEIMYKLGGPAGEWQAEEKRLVAAGAVSIPLVDEATRRYKIAHYTRQKPQAGMNVSYEVAFRRGEAYHAAHRENQ